jgi:hypothetical protein
MFHQIRFEQDQYALNEFVDVIPSQVPEIPDEADTPKVVCS